MFVQNIKKADSKTIKRLDSLRAMLDEHASISAEDTYIRRGRALLRMSLNNNNSGMIEHLGGGDHVYKPEMINNDDVV